MELAQAQKPSHPAVDSSTPCITIDKGVPMPRPEAGRGGATKYPWRTMEIGDSFVMREYVDRGSTIRVSAQINFAGKSTGRKFAQRRVEENGKRVIRIWRVA